MPPEQDAGGGAAFHYRALEGLFAAAPINALFASHLKTSFNLLFSRPIRGGQVVAEGRWISGRRRVLVAEARLVDAEGEEIWCGTGTFMRSHIPLSGLAGYGART